MMLSGPRVRLRPFHPSDVDALYRLLSHPQVIKHLPDEDHLVSRAQASLVLNEMITDTQRGRRRGWALIRQTDQQVIGTVVINRHNKRDKSAYVAYELAPSCWGQGLMHEALMLVVAAAPAHFDLATLNAQTTRDNHRSQRTLERCGFVRMRVFAYDKPVGGQHVQAWLYTCALPPLLSSTHHP